MLQQGAGPLARRRRSGALCPESELVSGKRLILYCGSGGRSALAGKALAEMGIADVGYMAGGLVAWGEAAARLRRAETIRY
jgi:rhodanese-related sulfurtransferase